MVRMRASSPLGAILCSLMVRSASGGVFALSARVSNHLAHYPLPSFETLVIGPRFARIRWQAPQSLTEKAVSDFSRL